MATKVRQAVVTSTPPRSTKQRSAYSAADKQSLLDNFDLEVDDKTRAFRASLAAALSSFALRQDAELLKIPRELRGMKILDLENKWAGSWKETVQKMLQDKIAERERAEKAERDRLAEEEMKLKRKRAEEAEATPSRNNKNARREPGTAKKIVPGSTSKRRPVTKTPRSKPSGSALNRGPSTLPQDHIFNPALPNTPAFPRQAKRNESFFSANGSPILIPYTGSSSAPSESEAEDQAAGAGDHTAPRAGKGIHAQSDTDEDDADLPDPAALEAQILAQTQSQHSQSQSQSQSQSRRSPKSNPSRKKRGPSLIFRQSLALSHPISPDDGIKYSTIPLSDGRVITFNPLALDRDVVEGELEQGGLGSDEKKRVMQMVKDETFKALTEKIKVWQV